jgi:HSP20 family protein
VVTDEHSFEEEAPRSRPAQRYDNKVEVRDEEAEQEVEVYEDDEEDEEPGLAVDIYESDNELVLQGMIAGVTPENLHISITRNSVTIRGKRNAPQGIPEEHYISRELYWGSFSRVIELPYEVDTEGAEAVEKYGLLIIRLPKLDVARTQELKVKSIQ